MALHGKSDKLFGIKRPLGSSAAETSGPYRSATQTAYDQVLVAKGLKVDYLTRNAANATDMIAFFPAQNPTHLITCVEGGRQTINAAGKLNPSVQRISLTTGAVETILRGMTSCDGIRTTAWGTILATCTHQKVARSSTECGEGKMAGVPPARNRSQIAPLGLLAIL